MTPTPTVPLIAQMRWLRANPDRAYQALLDVVQDHGRLKHFDPDGDLDVIQMGKAYCITLVESTPAMRLEEV